MAALSRDDNADGQNDRWGSQAYITWDRIQIHVNGWGGHLVDPQNPRKMRLADPPALAAQEWLRARMWDEHVMATPLDVHNQWPDDVFVAGKIAMVEEGSWRLRNILKNARFRIGVAPFPAGPDHKVTLANNDGFGIYAGTRQRDAAWVLLQFLVGKDFGRALARAGLLQPARASLVGEWAGIVRSQFPEQTQGMEVEAFADGQRKGYAVVAEAAANMAEATRIANAAWDQIFALGQAPVDILKEAARQIDAAQNEPGAG